MKTTVKSAIHNPILFHFILLSFMKPESLNYIGIPRFFNTLWFIWSVITTGLIFLLFFIYLLEDRRLYVDDIVAFYIYRILASITVCILLHNTYSRIGYVVHVQRLAFILFMAIGFKEDHDTVRNRLFYILALYSIINFITILMFPSGMYVLDDVRQNYFLGFDNGHIVLLLPALFISVVYYNETGHKVLPFVVWISVLFSVIICKSATSVAGIAFLIIELIAIKYRVIRRYLINRKTLLLLILVIFFVIIVFRLQGMFSGIITVLGKDSTFTGRTILWDRAFESIKRHPIFGVGDNPDINIDIFTYGKQKLAYAHNEMLDVLVKSGIIGLLLYLFVVVRSVSFNKEVINDKVWLVFMAAFWLMMIFESYSNYTFYYLYFVMLIYPRFKKTVKPTKLILANESEINNEKENRDKFHI